MAGSRNKRITQAALALALAVLCSASPASARGQAWSDPVAQGSVSARDLSQVRARSKVIDRVLRRGRARASNHPVTRVETYTDEHGHTIRLGTAIDGLDLQPYAQVLASTVHTDELSELRTLVVAPDAVSSECGGTHGDGVVACYGADDPDRLFAGEMVIPSNHADLTHAIVHEYGHHLDNALLNLAHLDLGCDFSQDGSRRWFFARDAADDLFGQSGCNDRVSYTRLLFELFAEDFVALNGIDEWFSSDFPPPTQRMLHALSSDIGRPFKPRRTRYRGTLGPKRRLRIRMFGPTTPTFFSAELVGQSGRARDLDLYLWRAGARKPLEVSRRRGSREGVHRRLAPGRYEVGVHAYRGRGRYRLVVDLD